MSGIITIASTQAEYAIAALVELALGASGQTLRSPQIAQRLEIPPASLEQVLVRLRRHGLVRSFRGASGGYALAADPEEINVADVLAVFLPTRDEAGAERPEVTIRQVVWERISALERGWARDAGDVRLADLAREARQRNEAMAYMPGL
jgi:Rrf2 family protein